MPQSDKKASDDEEIQNLILECVKIGISEGWADIPAKWKGPIQTLLVHGWNASSLTLDIMNFIGDFSQESKKIGVIASFFHDYTKAWNQHDKLPEDVFRKIVTPLDLNEDELKKVFAVITEIENPTTPDRFFAQISTRWKGDKRISDVCRLADQLLVSRSLTELELTKGAKEILNSFNLTIEYHLVSPVRGISTQILHRALEKYYINKKFMPILFFPEGTLYLGRQQVEQPKREMLLEVLKKEFDKLFNENPAFQQGGRAFGSWTATLITDVTLALSSNHSIKSFWETVYRKPIITGWLIKNRTLDALYQAVFYLFYALKALILELAEKIEASISNEQLYSDFLRIMREELGLSTALSKTILTISHTTNSKMKKQLGKAILNNSLSYLQASDRSPEASLETLKDKLITISQRLRSKYISFVERVPQKVLEELLDDVNRPLPTKVKEQIGECWEAFVAGKREKGTPICCFCARPAERVASSSMFGKGAESFNNFLVGGSTITGSNKAQICLLCEFEEKLRRALRGNYDEVIYIFPQVTLSRSLWGAWDKTSQALLTGISHIAVELNPLSRYEEWSRIIIEGGMPEKLDSLKDFYSEARHKKAWIRQLISQLRKNWEDLENLRSWVPKEITNFNELAEAILAGKVIVPQDYKEYLAEGLLEGARINLASNPNFIVVLTDSLSLRYSRDESETTLALRKLFVGLLLSKLLHSSVIFPCSKQETIAKIEPRGAVYEAQKTGLKKVLEIIGVKNGWIPFSKSTNALRYLSALMLCERYLNSANADMGKDTLIKLPNLIPGQILNRYIQSGKKRADPDPDFFILLDLLEEARRKAGFMGR
jgi:hypothetical protein